MILKPSPATISTVANAAIICELQHYVIARIAEREQTIAQLRQSFEQSRRELADAIRERLEKGEDRIADLHVWRLGPGHHGAIVSLVSHEPEPVEHYKARLTDVRALSHVTVEVYRCPGDHG